MKKLLSNVLLGVVLLFTLFVSIKAYDYYKEENIQNIEIEEVEETKEEHKESFKDKEAKSKHYVKSYKGQCFKGKKSKEYLEEYEYNSQENLFDDESIVNL